MNLLIEYYKSTNEQRDKEYLFCINQNIFNDYIKNIFVFISDDSELHIKSSKIKLIKVEQRPTFFDLFDFCNQNLIGQICIISNTDIFFDDSLKLVIGYDLSNKFLALTRWDVQFRDGNWFMGYYDLPWRNHYNNDGSISDEESIRTGDMSQDAWIFNSPIKTDGRMNFLMGKPGCDNRISQLIYECGLQVNNPSKKIIIKHLHQTNHRTYNNNDLVAGPYLLIRPSDDLNNNSKVRTINNF